MNDDQLPHSAANPKAQLLSQITSKGWTKVPYATSSDLVEIARCFGTPVSSRTDGPLIDRLVPMDKEHAHQKSMSAIFGKGAFPFHTDSANFSVPPRYVLLRRASGSTSTAPTAFVDWRSLNFTESERLILRTDVWFVSGGRTHFYTPILNTTKIAGAEIFRFDPCCMRPAIPFSLRSAEIIQTKLREGLTDQIEWEEDVLLILDNWRMLHARPEMNDRDSKFRVLERILLQERAV